MMQDAPNYHHDHYAAQNRKEMGAAISKHLMTLNAQEFAKMLDMYDKDYLHPLSSIAVPEPVEMIKKLIPQKKRTDETEETTAAALRECCGFLNTLIKLLPCM